jgi:CRP-like cAMP-binding protein
VTDVEVKFGCARLPEAELAALASYAAKASWPAGFALYERGAPADGLFVVLRGRVVLRNRVKAGRGYVPMMVAEGEIFGLEGLAPDNVYMTDARADEATETYHLSSARFRAFLREQPQHAIALVGQVASEHAMLLGKLRELATQSVEQRLVSALARMARHGAFTSSDGRITLSAAQYRLLCELVGATRESVTLVVNRLVAQGLAERHGSDFVLAPPHSLFQHIEGDAPDGELRIPLAIEGNGRQSKQATA